MSNTNCEDEKKGKNRVRLDIVWIPLIAAIIIIPLISRLHGENPGISEFEWSGGGMYQKDIFIYWKAFAITLLFPVTLIILLAKWKEQEGDLFKLRGGKIFLFLAVYELMMLISSIFSEYSEACFQGAWAVHESVYVLLCYGLLAFYGYVVLRKDKRPIWMLALLGCGAFLVGIIAFFQMFGLDFFRSKLGFLLAAGDTGWENWQKTVYWYEIGRVQSTLANPNNYGHYAAMLLPVLLVPAVGLKEKGKYIQWLRIFLGVGAVLMCTTMLAAASKSGIVATAVTTILGIVLFRHRLFSKTGRKYSFAILGGVVLLVTGVVLLRGQGLISNLKNGVSSMTDKVEQSYFLGAETTENGLLVHLQDELVLVCYDSAEKNLSVVHEDQSLEEDLEINGIKFSCSKIGETGDFYILDEMGARWNFTREYRYCSPLLGTVELHFSSDVLRGHESMATGRGYIWGRAIPLLKSRILLGTGANSTLFYFPQDDYIARERFGYGDMMITKPHAVLLQVGIDSGWIGLACYLLFLGAYVFWSIRLFWKSEVSSIDEVLAIGVFLGIIAYQIAGLAVDSSVCVSPVYYCLVGFGFALNYRLAKQKKIYYTVG